MLISVAFVVDCTASAVVLLSYSELLSCEPQTVDALVLEENVVFVPE